jgi:hypothetical protein
MEQMTSPFLRRVLTLALCACLAVTLVTVFSPTRSAHAATANRASCTNHDMAPGSTIWFPGDATIWHTCQGTQIKLTYQTDGNFVLYIGGKPKWATNTSTLLNIPVDTIFQSDGNLVVYQLNVFNSDVPVWASHTERKGVTTLALQHDGNLVIYTAAGKALWASHTCCYS